MDIEEYLQSAKRSLFRFEYLQEFDILEERELLRTYEATGKAEIHHLMEAWWSFLEKKHQEGVSTQRVRLVRSPMTTYLELELYIHRKTSEYGDDIWILDEKKLTPRLEACGDFWLIDDAIALKMNYDSGGKYLGFEKEGSQAYIKAKEYLLRNSISIVDFNGH